MIPEHELSSSTVAAPANLARAAEQVLQVLTLEPSRYLDYLPAVYRQDEFMGRFLLIFESVLGPLEGVVDELPLYTDPSVCPEEILPYLAHWVALSLDERWSQAQRRRMIQVAAELYRWRGTRRGLRAYMQAVAGVTPLIFENTDGCRLGSDNRLGLSMRLGREVPNCVTVVIPLPAGEKLDEAEVAALLESEKPAHAVYVLRIVPRQASPGAGGGVDAAALPEPAAT